MALPAKLWRRHCASGEGEDSENRALGDPFIETQRCFCLQHRGLEPEENEQLVEPLLNEFPRMRKKNLTSARDRYADAFTAYLLASASSSAGRSAELHLPRSVES